MFGPVFAPTFRLVLSPSQTAVQGTCTSSVVSVSPLVSGLTNVVNLSVTGLPANASASFNPATIVGAGSSTMTVCAAISTPVGSSTPAVTGTQGQEVETQPITFAVTPLPDFSISASPSSQSAFQGTSSTFNISTSVVGGFNGVETLSMSGLPPGATARFLSPSITGAGSSAFVTTTSSTTPAGNYTITITGTSGALSHSTAVGLMVKMSTPVCTHLPCTVTQ
jgi:hypothetical protein